MKFEPKPANPFPDFINAYYSQCREACPGLCGIAGKWTFEDLIPGLSDFDTRLIFRDGFNAADWDRVSVAVGRIHADMTRSHPRWARILEHLPGINLTVSELLDPVNFYPEFPQWTFYHGDKDALDTIEKGIAARPWSKRDELFHLKRFAAYYGPYVRGIDPAINMGLWESKYPLHSRYMHYFAPAIQAAVSLTRKWGTRGKFESLRAAHELWPNPGVMDRINDTVARHYEVPADYEPARLDVIEAELDVYLREVWASLADKVTLVSVERNESVVSLRAKVGAVAVDPAAQFFEGARFARLMKGRLLFYAEEIACFDSAWLIRNELGRIVKSFHDMPLQSYGIVALGKKMTPAEVLAEVRGKLVSEADAGGVEEFAKRASATIPPGRERTQAREAAEVYQPMLRTLETLRVDLTKKLAARSNEKGQGHGAGLEVSAR